MNFLFAHQNFPGQFVHIVRHLVSLGHEVVFIGEPNANAIPGVRRIHYRLEPKASGSRPSVLQDLETALGRAAAVAAAAQQIKRLGFRPDLIIGHHGWGELLNLQDVWPGAPLLGYYEFFYAAEGLDVGFDPEFPETAPAAPGVRAKNLVNLLALASPGQGLTPTRFQWNTYPAWAREKIHVVEEGVRLDLCRPASVRQPLAIGGITLPPTQRLVTFVARDLEPYRGFHVVMRALPGILRAFPDAHVVLVGGDGVSYGPTLATGSWREKMLVELSGLLDLGRVHFPGRVDYEVYLQLLQRSDAHIYFTYPFVASWSLREALACGCAIIGSDTQPVREFITHGENGVLTPFLDPAALCQVTCEVLEGGSHVAGMRAKARAFAEMRLSIAAYLERFEILIGRSISGEGA